MNCSATYCPWLTKFLLDINWSDFIDLCLIDVHYVFDGCSLQHPILKEIVLTGSLQGSTPLLVACGKGSLEAVRWIVEEWQADVNRAAIYYM